jgi:hypothetical protein
MIATGTPQASRRIVTLKQQRISRYSSRSSIIPLSGVSERVKTSVLEASSG